MDHYLVSEEYVWFVKEKVKCFNYKKRLWYYSTVTMVVIGSPAETDFVIVHSSVGIVKTEVHLLWFPIFMLRLSMDCKLPMGLWFIGNAIHAGNHIWGLIGTIHLDIFHRNVVGCIYVTIHVYKILLPCCAVKIMSLYWYYFYVVFILELPLHKHATNFLAYANLTHDLRWHCPVPPNPYRPHYKSWRSKQGYR